MSNLAAILGDVTQAHFPPESFDVVYLCTVLGEIPGREAALRRCYAALKGGGLLSITEIFPDPHYQNPVFVCRLSEVSITTGTGLILVSYYVFKKGENEHANRSR